MAFPSAPPYSKELTFGESKSASHGRHARLLSRIEEGTRAESVACETAVTAVPSSLEGRAQNIKVWKEFPKQNQAITFANSSRYSVGVFSFESAKFGTAGQRHFVVSALHTFVHRYLDLLEAQAAHFYEVITEGTVCRLYFDIEYYKQSNPLVDGIEVLEIFIQFVCYCLYDLFGIHCDRQQILDLDSSSENKFSRHLIFHFADAVFQNNSEVGKFVDFICSELRALKSTSSFQYIDPTPTHSVSKLVSWKLSVNCPAKESLLKLFVKSDKGSEVLICDEGVYTKNRNFRLYMSSKLGKDISLKLANENKFITKQTDPLLDPRTKHINILFDSLISHTPFDTNLRILSFTHPSLPLEPDHSTLPSYKLSNTDIGPSIESGESSPFPLLDAFIMSIITGDGVNGRIRRVTYFSEGRAVMFDIAGHRYCENIQRHHRSNNIMIIANLERMTYYQKCYDPECKRVQFKSNEMPIPIEIYSEDIEENEHFDTEINIDTITDFSEDISDNEWMQIAEELETSAVYAMEP